VTALKSLYFKLREPVRLNPQVSRTIYVLQSLRHSHFGSFRRRVLAARSIAREGEGVALCCRIRDEARYLAEFVEYYVAAGIDHFFFYEKLSMDNFADVLAPYTDRGFVTVCADWPHVPVSPSAEEDCIVKSVGRFRWVGFIDADEFVVVRDGRSIGDFLSEYTRYPAVALHWLMFGSNGHKTRPDGPVIAEYTRRAVEASKHVKCFVRPEYAANYRNSHSWFYQKMQCAVNELGRKVTGSISLPPTAQRAWVNHYHHKSDEDYFEKAARKSVLDVAGINFKNRTMDRHHASEVKSNAMTDCSSLNYYLERCRVLNIEPILTASPSSSAAYCGGAH
jgi:hypothetical protein